MDTNEADVLLALKRNNISDAQLQHQIWREWLSYVKVTKIWKLVYHKAAKLDHMLLLNTNRICHNKSQVQVNHHISSWVTLKARTKYNSIGYYTTDVLNLNLYLWQGKFSKIDKIHTCRMRSCVRFSLKCHCFSLQQSNLDTSLQKIAICHTNCSCQAQCKGPWTSCSWFLWDG